MTQATPIIGANPSGLTYRQDDNDGKRALLNHHKAATAPAYAEAGILWLDDATTPWLLKFYDGANWITLGAINASDDTFAPYLGAAPLGFITYATDGGSADAYEIAPAPSISAYAAGQVVALKPSAANTGAATLAVSGLAAKNIKMPDGTTDLPANAMTAGGIFLLVYTGSQFVLTNPATSGPAALQARGTTLASASTVDIGAADSDYVEISGTTTITSLGTTTTRNHLWVKFQDALILTHDAAALILPTGADITTAAGDIAAFARISAGNWQCLGYQRVDGTALTAATAGYAENLDDSHVFFDDFDYAVISDAAQWLTGVSGTSAKVEIPIYPNDNINGIVSLSTGTTATGTAFILAGRGGASGYTGWLLGVAASDTILRARLLAVSTSTQRVTAQIGLILRISLPDTPNDGVYFRVVDNVNSGNWQAVCVKDSTETVINTSVPASTDYTTFRITIDAAASSATFFINGANVGTTTTNIPDSSSVGYILGESASLKKSTGTTESLMYLDYVKTITTRI